MDVLEVDQEITAFNTFPKEWWGRESNFKFGKVAPLVVTGAITKVFKSGKLLVAINEMPNVSADGKASMHIEQDNLVSNWDVDTTIR